MKYEAQYQTDGGDWWGIGYFKSLARAKEEGEQWRSGGHKVRIVKTDSNGRTVKKWLLPKTKKRNPARTPRRKTANRKNAPKSRTISLKGFTGKVRQCSDGTLKITGKGKRA